MLHLLYIIAAVAFVVTIGVKAAASYKERHPESTNSVPEAFEHKDNTPVTDINPSEQPIRWWTEVVFGKLAA